MNRPSSHPGQAVPHGSPHPWRRVAAALAATLGVVTLLPGPGNLTEGALPLPTVLGLGVALAWAGRAWATGTEAGSNWAGQRRMQAASWPVFELDLTHMPPSAGRPEGRLRFESTGPAAWTAEHGAWRIEMACDGPATQPWQLALQSLGPQPEEPWTIARAASMDDVLALARAALDKLGGACALLAQALDDGIEIYGPAEWAEAAAA